MSSISNHTNQQVRSKIIPVSFFEQISEKMAKIQTMNQKNQTTLAKIKRSLANFEDSQTAHKKVMHQKLSSSVSMIPRPLLPFNQQTLLNLPPLLTIHLSPFPPEKGTAQNCPILPASSSSQEELPPPSANNQELTPKVPLRTPSNEILKGTQELHVEDASLVYLLQDKTVFQDGDSKLKHLSDSDLAIGDFLSTHSDNLSVVTPSIQSSPFNESNGTPIDPSYSPPKLEELSLPNLEETIKVYYVS